MFGGGSGVGGRGFRGEGKFVVSSMVWRLGS